MDGIHQTLLRPANNIAQDYLKFLEDSMLFERMQKKIGRDFASTSFSQYLCHSICDGARGSKPGGGQLSQGAEQQKDCLVWGSTARYVVGLSYFTVLV